MSKRSIVQLLLMLLLLACPLVPTRRTTIGLDTFIKGSIAGMECIIHRNGGWRWWHCTSASSSSVGDIPIR
jgi:hypothetical protein